MTVVVVLTGRHLAFLLRSKLPMMANATTGARHRHAYNKSRDPKAEGVVPNRNAPSQRVDFVTIRRPPQFPLSW